MQTIEKAGPADLIALVWFRLGYRPRESVVLVGLDGPRHQAGLIIRADLIDAGHGEQARQLAATLTGTGARAAVALVVSERAGLTPGVRRPALVRSILRELRCAGVTVFDVLWVGPQAYASYLCADPGCCPPGGQPLSAAMSSRTAAELVLDGRVVAADEAALVADVVPLHEPAGGEAATPDDPPNPPGDGAPPLPGRRDLASWLRLWRGCLAAGVIEPAAARRLAEAMDDVRLRDAVMVTFLPGAGAVPEALLASCPPSSVDHWQRYDRLMAATPDPELLGRATALLAGGARSAPAGSRAPALGCLAWVAWWSGEGARARLLAGMALQDRPEYSLAVLVEQALAATLPPPWVGVRDRSRTPTES